MLPLFGVRRFGQPSAMVEPLPAGIVNPMGGGGAPLNFACFNFSGSNYASIAALSANLIGGGGDFAIAWRQFVGATSGAERSALTLYGNGNNFVTMWEPRSSDANETIYAFVNSGNISAVVALLTFESWENRHLTYTASDKKIRLYKNGVLVKTTSAAASTFASLAATKFLLGANSSGGGLFLGRQADIRLYSAVVTPNHSIPMTQEANGVAWYITPKADGSIVDSLGNGNTLTTTGDSLYGASGGPGLPWWPV